MTCSLGYHTGEDFASQAQQRDSPVIVAVLTVTFVFVQGDYVSVFQVLWNAERLPA